MNGDQPSAAAAPLDLRTTNRERPGGSEERGLPQPRRAPAVEGDAPRLGATRSPPGSQRRSEDTNSRKLPFRKRPIPVEAEIQSAPSPPAAARSCSPVGDSSADRAAPRSPGRTAQTDTFQRSVQPPSLYGFYPVYPVYFSAVPELNHSVPQQTENLFAAVALATHQDDDGDTALHIAVVQGELSIVCTLIHLLLLAGRSLDIYNNIRQTPLHLAVITQQADMVGLLLRAGADPSPLDRNGQTALHLCCEYNHGECLSVVLAHSRTSSPLSLETRNYEGLSPLHLAVLHSHKDLARQLLEAGADINAMDIKSGQSPLMHAIESNNTDMVNFLIENGSDVNGQSYCGNAALHVACGRGQVNTVRLLLRNGADSSLKNYHNDTPVMVAKNKHIADVLRGRGSKFSRDPDHHCVSASLHGSNLLENGSPSPSRSPACSPLAAPHTPHSPKPWRPAHRGLWGAAAPPSLTRRRRR